MGRVWLLIVTHPNHQGHGECYAGRYQVRDDPPPTFPGSPVGLSGWASEAEAKAAFDTAKLGMPRWWPFTATPVAFERT